MSDELSAALRELAARHEAAPPLAAAEVRDRARRRSRRRRTVLALGTAATAACAVTVVTLAPHTGHPTGERHRPGAPPATSPSPARPSATPTRAPRPSGRLDPRLRTLTFGDRVLRVDLRAAGRLPSGARLTVVARSSGAVLPLRTRTEVREVKVPHLVELRAPGGEHLYAGALSFDAKVLRALAGTTGWVGLSARDAEWLHDRLRDGDRIELATTPAPR